LWLALGTLTLLYLGGCRRGVPGLDLRPRPPLARGTITGLVHGPGDAVLSGRTIEAVNVLSGERHTVMTATNGGFAMELPQGKYRLELQLHEGETLARHAGIVDLDRGDSDPHVEFVVSATRAARRPSYRLDNGLGSPIA
jgi:hypothetical protein